MKTINYETKRKGEEGALGWGILWLMGVPVSILFVLFLLRGCT